VKAKTLDPQYLQSQYQAESEFHRALLAQPEVSQRHAMYVAAYGAAYQASATLSPDEIDFGFVGAEMDCVLPWMQGKTVVDYGCGYGSSTLYAAKAAAHVVGCDILPGVIEVAQTRLNRLPSADTAHQRVTFQVVPPASFDFAPASIDGVYASDVVEHFHPDDFQQWLTGVYAALRPGGWLCIITPHRCYGPSDISKHFVTQTVGPGPYTQSVSQGFHIVEYGYGDLQHKLQTTGFVDFKTPALSPRQLCHVANWPGSTWWGWTTPWLRHVLEHQSWALQSHWLRKLVGLNRSVFLMAYKPI
jgi:SAM-dependent methyltransferase